jgi:hypothetical protein
MWSFKKKQKTGNVEYVGHFMNYSIEYRPPTAEEKLAELTEKVHLMEQFLEIHLVDPPKGYRKIRKYR